MFARVTMFEIDMLRISPDDALAQFKQAVLPEVRKQEGYEGLFVLRTPEGKGCILSMWASEEAAIAGEESGYYDEQISKFVSFFKSPPGRDRYEVMFSDGKGISTG